ncbi:sulfatase [Glaciecola sp. KUL10]|uniref:sulfatase n=1 Tax=Glaciecola sp. (strain KUL10) TaxID=2161813 RepID=UPI000D78C294|nr:sulfatase [Glaciecola sp. KUL10]GBL05322.1 aryl-sulphate sulphohydrolase [Glaciecola sp. KUL10]
MKLGILRVAAIILLSACASAAQQSDNPNIIMIVVDDLGWADVGYNQTTEFFETPNIDALARQSIRFSNAYAGAANCAPSRAVLMTGQYGPRHGIYTVSPSTRGDAQTRKLIPVKNVRGLPPEAYTLAEALKKSGYTTGHFGKWHLGIDPDSQGFDKNVAGSGNGMTFHYYSPYKLPNIKDGPNGEYLTRRLTNEVIDWIRSSKDQPFFAYVPYYSVHTPFQADEDLVQKYVEKGVTNKKEATYAAMVEHMDKNVGRILEMLETEGLRKDTLVIFTSDNGGYKMSNFPSPLRAGKGSYYEGGLRVPLLVSWLTKIKPSDNATPVINADFFPTLISIANNWQTDILLDGVDISKLLLAQEPVLKRDLFWHFPVYLQAHNSKTDQGQDPLFRTRPGSAMRSENWKLIHYFENNEYELYDLSNDVGETNNLAATFPAQLDRLKAKLNEWRDSVNAPIPTKLNPEYDDEVNQALIEEKLKTINPL